MHNYQTFFWLTAKSEILISAENVINTFFLSYISRLCHPNLYIYKRPEVFSFAGSLLPNSSWTNGQIWTNDISLEPAWHVDGFFWLKFFIPTPMEWPGTETCPKSSRIANNSETMCQIENLRSHYFLQLLILSTGAHFQRVSEHYMVTRTFLLILTLERSSRCPVQYYIVRHP